MEKQLLMFPSITYAIKGRDLLKTKGISSYLERTPMDLKVNSCGYSLSIPKNIDKAIEILRNHNIKFLGKARSGAK